jgi:hypothetical protein
MKIDDIINCINRNIKDDRLLKNLNSNLGHFVCHYIWKRHIGAVKEFIISISFVKNKKNVILVVDERTVVNCKLEKIEEYEDKIALSLLSKFLKILHIEYDKFVTGEYE